MTTNSNRHCYVDYNGKPYIQQFGVPCLAHQNYKYTPQPEKRGRTIIRNNRPIYHTSYIEGFDLSNKKSTQSCDCDE